MNIQQIGLFIIIVVVEVRSDSQYVNFVVYCVDATEWDWLRLVESSCLVLGGFSVPKVVFKLFELMLWFYENFWKVIAKQILLLQVEVKYSSGSLLLHTNMKFFKTEM